MSRGLKRRDRTRDSSSDGARIKIWSARKIDAGAMVARLVLKDLRYCGSILKSARVAIADTAERLMSGGLLSPYPTRLVIANKEGVKHGRSALQITRRLPDFRKNNGRAIGRACAVMPPATAWVEMIKPPRAGWSKTSHKPPNLDRPSGRSVTDV